LGARPKSSQINELKNSNDWGEDALTPKNSNSQTKTKIIILIGGEESVQAKKKRRKLIKKRKPKGEEKREGKLNKT